MDYLTEAFSTREWAMVILMALAILGVLLSVRTRGPFGRVVRALFQRSIVVVFLVGTVYVATLVYGLHAVGLWTSGDIPSTIFWMLTSASISIINFQKARSEPRYYRHAVLEVLGITTLFVFVTDLLSISLWFWLIAIPLLTSLQLLILIAKREPEHAAVAKLLSWIEAITGAALLYFVLRTAITSWDEIATRESIRLFALSAALSVAFLPFIYVLALYEPYERIFGILPSHIKDAGLRRAARWRAIWHFRTDVDFLERWRRMITTKPPTNMGELEATFVTLRTIKRRERDSEPVSDTDGWHPQVAIAFLKDECLVTSDYHEDPFDEGEWWASSPLIEIGDEPMPNNVAFYVYGTASAVTRLKLKLNVNQPADDQAAKARFTELCGRLAERSVGSTVAQHLRRQLVTLTPFEAEAGHAHVALTRDQWKGGIIGGYSLIFEVFVRQ